MRTVLVAVCTAALALAAPSSVTVDVGYSLGALDRSAFMNIHSSPGLSNWRPEDIDLFAGKLRAHLGRSFVFSGRMSTCKNDPSKPGFVDPESLTKACSAHPTGLFGWPNASVSIVHSSKTVQLFSNACGRGGTSKGFVSNGSVAGTADFFKRYVTTPGCFLHTTPQSIVEVMNEPYVKLDGCGTTWDDLVDIHVAIADALHAIPGSDYFVTGPTSAFPEFEAGRVSFQDFDNNMGAFIRGAGRAMDGLSVHLYDTYNITDHTCLSWRSGANVDAILDTMQGYLKNVTGVHKPISVSEYGSGFKNPKPFPYQRMGAWFILRGVNAKLLQFLGRPDIIKAVPFIVAKATWEAGPYPYPFVLWTKNATGGWDLTDLVLHYQLWADVDGDQVVAHSTTKDVLSRAFVDGSVGATYIVLHNLNTDEATEAAVQVSSEEAAGAACTVATLALDGDHAALTTTKYPGGLPPIVALPPAATVVVTLESGAAPARKAAVTTTYSPTVFANLTGASPSASFPLEACSAPASVAPALLRVSMGGGVVVTSRPPTLVLPSGRRVKLDFDEFAPGHVHTVPAPASDFFDALTVPVPAEDVCGHGAPVVTVEADATPVTVSVVSLTLTQRE